MKKHLALSLALLSLLTVGLMVGCNNPGPGGGGGGDPQVISIVVEATHTQITGVIGESRSETIIATARDAGGVAVPGVRIDFMIQNPLTYKGTIAKMVADSLSNDNGQVHATYSVVIERTTAVVLEARCQNAVGRITLNVEESSRRIGSVSITPSNGVLTVPQSQSRSRQFTATLVDTAGIGISGMQLRFRTSPASMGVIDSDTGTTDNGGKVARNFSSIVGQYGRCDIIASVGSVSNTATIEIRQVSAPAFISIRSPAPTIQIASGQNGTINLEAVVSDSNRIGVPGAQVEFQVLPFIDGQPTFGAVSARDTTDADGKVTTVFNSLGEFGKLKIRVVVIPSNQNDELTDDIAAILPIEIKQLSNQIDQLTVRATPNILDLTPDSLGVSIVRAQVKDISKHGLPNVVVDFVADWGTLSQITVTDTNGVATARFTNDYVSGTATITASIPGTIYEGTCTVKCNQSVTLSGTLTVSTQPDFVYADNGLTATVITAVLKDQNDVVIVGKPVSFSTRMGQINASAVTDTLGRAVATFIGGNLPSQDANGLPIPVYVHAMYNALHLDDSCAVTIRPKNPVTMITLTSNRRSLMAGSGDSALVRATCFLQSGGYAPSGTTVRFTALDNNGTFTVDAMPVSGTFGVAETYYIAGALVGTAVLQAFVVNETGDSTSSNQVEVTLLAGPPSGIRITAIPNTLYTNDPAAFSTITAFVTDTSGNPVRQGELVSFSTTKGDVMPSALTDTLGRAMSRLTAGVESGVAVITGSVTTPTGTITGTATVTFVAGYPNVMEMSSDPGQIAVAGTGQISTATIRATVKDANGNVVGVPAMVVFQLLNNPAPPLGCNINNHGDIDSARTANGTAVVSVNAGEQIGGVLIRAYTWRDPDEGNAGVDGRPRTDTVSVILSTLAVVSGPPFQLDIDVNDNGDDAGGGTWQMPVSARVWDVHRNPVADRVPVVFTVDPQIATIDPGATGNDIGQGITVGIAYSYLRYHSVNTFDPITISAEVQVENGQISADRAHVLPLQDGVLSLTVDPQNWMFDRARANDTCLIRCTAILTDGHQININGGPILFRTDRARYYWRNLRLQGRYIPFFPELARRFTGLVNNENNEENGHATVYLRGVMDDFYLDAFTLEVTVHCEANVEGYDVAADPAFVFMTRH